MKVIWTVMRKELSRVFKDPKLIVTVMILPGLLLYSMYSIMGQVMQPQEEELKPFVVHYHESVSLDFINELGDTNQIINVNGLEITLVKYEESLDNVDLLLENEEIQVFLTTKVLDQNDLINIKFNSDSRQSYLTATLLEDHLRNYVNVGNHQYRLASPESIISDEQTVNQVVSSMLPFLIMVFLFQGAMAVGPESIAGDKERGTISTLLATPTKRSHIAIGKIFSLSILSVMSAVSSFIGVIFSMDALVSTQGTVSYTAGEYFVILSVIVSTVILITSVIAVLSATAKNIKEASMLSMPLMIISMLVGIMTMLSSEASTNTLTYLIPLYNSSQALVMTFNQQVHVVNLLIVIFSNLLYALLFGYILTKQFNSEKIMFSK